MHYANMDKVAGIILAGGRSSRMGEDKATLKINGVKLIDRMKGILRSLAVTEIFICGDVKGYNCIHDDVINGGPARAIANAMHHLKDYDAALVVPVDMPLLSPDVLQHLLNDYSCYFKGYPMPLFIKFPIADLFKNECNSVYDLIRNVHAKDIRLDQKYHACMLNLNKPEDIKKIGQNESENST